MMRNKTLMIVEDSELIALRIKHLVEEVKGLKLISVTNSVKQTISALAKIKPEIILLDINLKDGSGIDLLRHIKKTMTNTTVIMLTNYSGIFYRNICKEAGADYYLDKSLEHEEIKVILTKLVSKN